MLPVTSEVPSVSPSANSSLLIAAATRLETLNEPPLNEMPPPASKNTWSAESVPPVTSQCPSVWNNALPVPFSPTLRASSASIRVPASSPLWAPGAITPSVASPERTEPAAHDGSAAAKVPAKTAAMAMARRKPRRSFSRFSSSA